MPDYSLGRAHGQIEIDYDGSGADRAERDLLDVAAASTAADKSLTKTHKTLGDTEKSMDSAGSSARGYHQRLKDVESASRDVESAERAYKSTLLDSKATLDDIKDTENRLSDARKRHTAAISAQRDAHKALSGEMSVSRRAASALASIIPNLSTHFDGLSSSSKSAAAGSNALSGALDGAAKGLRTVAPGASSAARGLNMAAAAIGGVVAAASGIGGAVKDITSFELAFGKIAGITLAVPSLAGLAGLGGAGAAQGMIEVAGAAKQLSGVLGLLPATIVGVGFATESLKVAFRGVGDALTDMMSDDPKKFLEDIKDMAPAAAQAMLTVASFRDTIRMSGGAIQQSFFAQIAKDIQPLIATWLPAITKGMAAVATAFGQGAHALAGMLQQPAMLQAFQSFVDNVVKGITALQPAIAPILQAFTQLVVTGSSFFPQISGIISQVASAFADLVKNAANSGALQAWIQDGINGFVHLMDIAASLGQAFLNIMDIADKFGGGGLLGWLDQMSIAFNNWTSSADGQKMLTNFFSVIKQASDALQPMLKPLSEGLLTLVTAFVQLGVAIAPGWQVFFDAFAASMAQLAPNIVSLAPALTNFLGNLGVAMQQLVAGIGPQLPQIFKELSDAFIALLPQLGPMVDMFLQLATSVGPMLPALFQSVTQLMQELVRYAPIAIGFITNFVSVVNGIVGAVTSALHGVSTFIEGAADTVKGAWDEIVNYLPAHAEQWAKDAEQWGKNMIDGLIRGIRSGISAVGDAAKGVVDEISSWFPHSPAKQGPFSGSGYTRVRGQTMITDLAAGMTAGQPAVEAAAKSTATVASNALGGGGAVGSGGAPSPGGSGSTGNALLPDNIASADTSILTAYLRHQFSDTHGLKGLAKSLGDVLDIAKGGFDLVNSHLVQPLFQGLGLLPGSKDQSWRKLSPTELATQQQSNMQKDALGGEQKHTWNDVFGAGAPGSGTGGTGINPSLGLTASSSKEDIQKAIIAAGRARGMSDGAIQAALAVAAAESGFNPTISGGVQGSAGLVSGLYQQSPSSGWGTLDQVNDPNHAINAFYDAFAKNLAKNPTNPQLAAVLTQNPQLGSNAQGSDYWNAVSNQLGLANSIMGAYGKTQGTVWGAGGSIALPTTATATGAATGISANPASRASTLGGANANYTPETLAAAGIAPLFTKTSPGSMAGAPAWVQQLASAFGLTATSHQDKTLHGGTGQMGDWAFDFGGAVPDMQRFADFIKTNLASQTLQAIWQNPTTGSQLGIAGGQILAPGQYYTTPGGSYGDHTDHVHWATDVAPVMMGPDGKPIPLAQPGLGSAAGLGAGLVLPSGQSLAALTDTSQKNLTVNDKLLQAYLQGNPALAQQIDAAKTPGAADSTVMGTLGSISKTIDTLKNQDAVGNKNTIDALQSTQTQIAQQQGFTQQQSPLQTAQSIASGVGSAVTGAFQVVSSTLDAMTATQDIADRLVYGLRNTEDVSKIVDDVQKYVTLAASIASEIGNVLSSIGGIMGAGAGADPTGGASGAAAGVQAAGSIAQLVGGILTGVNAAIDYGQQVYEITMGYVGRFMSYLTGLGGTNLMGNVGFLLNKNTGQLISYSQDNPQQQNVANVPSWMNSLYDYNGKGNPNPQVNQQLNVYAGPGQPISTVMNETMWMVNTQGTTGAMAPSNF